MGKVGGRAGVLAGMLAGVVLAWCACAAALDPSLDISQYAHTSWKIRDGFTTGAINALAQTSDGYLWLGTEFGLYRFDGVRTVPWQPPSGSELPSNNVFSLLVSRDGTLWIGTRSGLAGWKDGKLTIYPELRGQQVPTLLEDRDGTIWVGGIGVPPPGKLCAIRDRSAQCYGENGSLGFGIGRLYEDTKGNLWAGAEKGIWHWKPGSPEFFPMPDDLTVVAFAQDEEGRLLIGGRTGVKRLFDRRVEGYSLPGSAGHFWATRMLRDHDGSLWMANHNNGLVHLHQGKLDSFSEADGLSGNGVSDLFEDREGTIWAATSDGLDRFRPYSVPTITSKQGLSNGAAWSVLAGNDGSVWVGSSGGLDRWEHGQISAFGGRESVRKSNGSANPFSAADSLLQDSSGRIWMSTPFQFGYLEGGLFVPLIDVPGGYVHSIAEVPSGHLWIANQNGGLFHLFDGKVVEKFPWAKLGHVDHASVAVADPSQKGLWLGFWQGGLVYFANGQVEKTYSGTEGLGEGRVNDLRFGPRASLWVATEGGLSRIKDGHIATLTSKNGLPCNGVHWSIEDDEHSVWLYMPCGLVRVAKSELDAWAADPARAVRSTLFGAPDGIRSHAGASVYRAPVAKSEDGRIWFVVWDGVSIIDPHHLAFNKLPPPVHIEQVTADDKTYDATNGLRLPPHVRYLAIDYTALSLVAPEKVRFRYKLEGEDKDWREVVNKREVEYTNLAPKHYRFRVLACNNSGVWNKQGASLEFVIPPAWYQTRWFYALCAATFLLMLWGLYRLRVLQLQREFNAALEARVGERTRVARDLHDTLLQSFQALLPRLQAAIYKLPESPVEARKTLEVAVDQAAEAITEGRDAVQGLRMSTVEQNDLALAIRTVGEELASADGNQSSPEFNVVVEGTSRNLHPILRDEVYRLAAEALRNAFRHAAAHSVEVEIRYDEKHFRLRVRDDGKGIRDEVLRGEGREGHYGLHGMKERAALVGGKLTIWSEVDNGTEIELVIPASRAYAQPKRRFRNFGKRSPEEVDAKEMIKRE